MEHQQLVQYHEDGDTMTEQELREAFPTRYCASAWCELSGGKVQANFTQLACNAESSTLSCCNSSGDISVVDVGSMRLVASFKDKALMDGWSSMKSSGVGVVGPPVSAMRFSPKDGNLLFYAGSDCKIRVRDLRESGGEAQQTFALEDSQQKRIELTCFDINCSGEKMCAGTNVGKGCQAHLLFWDLRSSEMLGAYSDSHSDDVTAVAFHPYKRRSLCSAAMDSLLNFYDISKTDEDDAFVNCINFENTVDAVYWDTHKEHKSKLFATSYTKIAQYWDKDGVNPIANFGKKKLSRAIKRQVPEKCHMISFNFDAEHKPLFTMSSSEAVGGCVRTVFMDREKNKLRPHSVLDGARELTECRYLAARDAFVSVEDSGVRLWGAAGHKRAGEGEEVRQAVKKLKL